MLFIAHRGNINGPNPDLENSPPYILNTLKMGYDVEIDVWNIDGEWWLGHDIHEYKIDIDFLKNNKIWCHAKNIHSLHELLKHLDIHCFFHQTDDYTITSNGIIWAYPGKYVTENSIAVMPEYNMPSNLHQCKGICTDFVIKYANIYK
jgi:hypothetical protein